ncbi:hypothetical protein K2173_012063 [Erythroxylum novogranatense]|uniref:Magnesium transporter n=1 Tax=Erythroxylum novogranatense TaxID=1862640 RepID=A0AAV8TEX3_9ROSI|nr:hypothetical protein K2173_012063 [Erythroxylum novogranatense]
MNTPSKNDMAMEEETRHRAGGGMHLMQTRRKGIGVKPWLVVSEFGQTTVEEVGKQSIMRRTGLPGRDLRALDPVLSYPSSILGRERAIVVNLEHIRAIITAKEVLMLNSNNPLVVQFVEDLAHRITSANNYMIQQESKKNDMDIGYASEASWNSSKETMVTCQKVQPFEFRALEACLESACRCLDSKTQTLEKEAYPALDALTSKVSTLNLEHARQIKSRLVAISGRVQKVRDELEHLLDDDNDMAEMYLTEKLETQLMDQASQKEKEETSGFSLLDERSDDSHSSDSYISFKPDIEELEMLLEAYFAEIDGILQKLSHMSEYVDDTEDFINIMLDDKQNQLLQMEVTLGIVNLILNAGIAAVGVFGMNIHISLFDTTPTQFWETVAGICLACLALYVFSIAWTKKQNLLAL